MQALQTEAADLKTMVSLQTDVAALKTQLTPDLASAATPAAGEKILYQADWSSGLDGWSAPTEWQTVGGMLVNDGSNPDRTAWLVAPFRPTTADYAVEAEIQYLRRNNDNSAIDCLDVGFGLAARASGTAGYFGGVTGIYRFSDAPSDFCVGGEDTAGIWTAIDTIHSSVRPTGLGEERYTAGNDWHTYRLEAKANTIRLLIDGREIARGADNQHLAPGEVGLFSRAAQINVRSFKVIAL